MTAVRTNSAHATLTRISHLRRRGGDVRSDSRDHGGAVTRAGPDLERPADGTEAVAHARRARSRPGRDVRREPLPVIGDGEGQALGGLAQLDVDPGGVRVLGGVLNSLQGAEVEGCLDV